MAQSSIRRERFGNIRHKILDKQVSYNDLLFPVPTIVPGAQTQSINAFTYSFKLIY